MSSIHHISLINRHATGHTPKQLLITIELGQYTMLQLASLDLFLSIDFHLLVFKSFQLIL